MLESGAEMGSCRQRGQASRDQRGVRPSSQTWGHQLCTKVLSGLSSALPGPPMGHSHLDSHLHGWARPKGKRRLWGRVLKDVTAVALSLPKASGSPFLSY